MERRRMTIQEWKKLPEKDKEVLRTLSIEDLVKPLACQSKPSPIKHQPLPKPYVLLRHCTCSICKTKFQEYFKIFPPQGNSYSLGLEKILPKDILFSDKIKEEKEVRIGCWYCYEVLSKESQKELIKRIIILSRRRI